MKEPSKEDIERIEKELERNLKITNDEPISTDDFWELDEISDYLDWEE